MSVLDGVPAAIEAASRAAACAAVVTKTGNALRGRTPRIVALERAVEIENIREFVFRVGRLADQQPELDQREHDIADVTGALDAPVLEYHAGHHAVSVKREIAA